MLDARLLLLLHGSVDSLVALAVLPARQAGFPHSSSLPAHPALWWGACFPGMSQMCFESSWTELGTEPSQTLSLLS